MTLEVLFAQQGQAETFLRMVLLGAAFALALTLGGVQSFIRQGGLHLCHR